jgi:hypothetical protein
MAFLSGVQFLTGLHCKFCPNTEGSAADYGDVCAGGLVERGELRAITSPILDDATVSCLFKFKQPPAAGTQPPDKGKGARMYTLFRHPVEAAVSLFYYKKHVFLLFLLPFPPWFFFLSCICRSRRADALKAATVYDLFLASDRSHPADTLKAATVYGL